MKLLQTLSFALLMLAFPAAAYATAQAGEQLEYEGEATEMFSTPLEAFFSEENPRPNDLLEATSTANWRGYIGHWKFEDNKLVLTGLYRDHYHPDEEGDGKWSKELIPADKIFGDDAEYPIDATWFSGRLRIPQGEMIRYVHMGFGSQYEKEVFIEIKDGEIIRKFEVIYDTERDAFRSQSDMQWVALGEGAANAADANDWIDGRLLLTPRVRQLLESGEKFRTRGIFFSGEELSHLWIPDTPKTPAEQLPIHRLPEAEIAQGSHVEVSAHFYKLEEGYGLEVESIKSLDPGETIHHPDFPGEWNDLQEAMKDQQGEAGQDDGGDSDSAPVDCPFAPSE